MNQINQMPTMIEPPSQAVAHGRMERLRCNFGTGEAIGTAIIWILLTIVTLGLALLIFPYYLEKVVLNRTEVLDAHERPIGRMVCRFGIASSIGHVILWAILILVTFGLASFLYAFRVTRVVLNETVIEYY